MIELKGKVSVDKSIRSTVGTYLVMVLSHLWFITSVGVFLGTPSRLSKLVPLVTILSWL